MVLLLKTRIHNDTGIDLDVERIERLLAKIQVTSFGDLNRASEEELQKAKDRMDIGFGVNQVRKGDPGFVYDVRADFEDPVEDSGWDSD